MVRRLLAVMVAATVVMGSVWATDYVDVNAPATANSNAFGVGSGSDIATIDATDNDKILSNTGTSAVASVIASTVDFANSNKIWNYTVKSLGTNAALGIGINTDGTALTDITNWDPAKSKNFNLTINGMNSNGDVFVGGTAKGLISKGDFIARELDVLGGSIVDLQAGLALADGKTLTVTGNGGAATAAGQTTVTIKTLKQSDGGSGYVAWRVSGGTGDAKATIVAEDGATINITDDTILDTSTDNAKVITIDDGSVINFAGKVTIAGVGNANAFTTTNAGTLTMGSLEVNANATISNVGQKTVVLGGTTIKSGKTYSVAGADTSGAAVAALDEYRDGIVVENTGVLQAAVGTGAAAVAISAGTKGITLQDGATLKNDVTGGTHAFTINGDGGVKVVATSTGGTAKIDSSVGAIVIDKALTVQNDLEMNTAAAADGKQGITAGSYSQTAGDVTFAAGNINNFIVKGAATIGGGTDAATFTVSNDGNVATNKVATFQQGVTVAKNGTIISATDDAAGINILNQTLTLSGGTLQTGATNNLNVYSTTGSKILVKDKGSNVMMQDGANFIADNAILEVDGERDEQDPTFSINSYMPSGPATPGTASFADILVKKGELGVFDGASLKTGKDIIVNKGAILDSDHGAHYKGNNAGTSQLIAHEGSEFGVYGDNVTIDNKFAKVDLKGNIGIGVASGGNLATITSKATATNVAATARVIYDNDAITKIMATDLAANPIDFIINDTGNADAITVSPTALVQYTARGQFTFAKNAVGTLQMVEAGGLVDGSGSEEALNQYFTNLQTMWGTEGAGAEISHDLADLSYAHSIQGNLAPTVDADNNNGQMSLDILDAMSTKGDAYSQGVGKAIFRNGDVGEVMSAGTGEVRGVNAAIGARNTQLRGEMASAAGASSGYASLALNNNYANRVWAGYLGQWERGDSSNGVAGYNYDSHGFIVGYDRFVGCNFAFGGAFGYSRGDYEDKTAVSNGSKIDNYTVSGYATYSALNGAFASLFGGYTFQKNDIKAVYAASSRSANYNTDYWNIGGQFGYDFQPVAGLVLTPSIGLQYIHGRAEAHSSWITNAGGTNFHLADAAKKESLLLPIELAAKYTVDFSNCSSLAIEGNVGYSYNFIDDDSAASMTIGNVQHGGNAVVIDGYSRETSRHTFNAGAGLRYTYDRFDIGLKYDYYHQKDAQSHRLMGTVGVSF